MKFTEKYSKVFSYLLPSPLSIALLLTLFTFLIAFSFTSNNNVDQNYLVTLVSYWQEGLWNPNLMVFALQMMLMLVLGHMLALTPFINKIINFLAQKSTTTSKAAAIVTFSTIIVALFNWGLGLIFGAIICRKIGEMALKQNQKLNYPLIGAAGYVGLMVWHGGISGSATTKVAEVGHLHNIYPLSNLFTNESSISLSETVFSPLNLFSNTLIIIALPTIMYFLGKRKFKFDLSFLAKENLVHSEIECKVKGAEKFDSSTLVSKAVGALIISAVILQLSNLASFSTFSFITPNFINLTLLGMAFFFHKNIRSFLKSLDFAIGGTAGILIQFPLYFGIMGIMKGSGMVELLSNFFVSISSETSFPIFTLISAGIVNVFVPSGGGQWAIQGPIIIQAAETLNASVPKSIMALAYGDQLTNMLQPFWALPLLGITKLKAQQILPYTLLLMLAGVLIFVVSLLLF